MKTLVDNQRILPIEVDLLCADRPFYSLILLTSSGEMSTSASCPNRLRSIRMGLLI